MEWITQMMQWLVAMIEANAPYAHWIIFTALMLAGLNIPISEDLMLITAGVLASTVIPEHTALLFIFTFLGCYLSDWEAYWIGRLLGPSLWKIKWFASMMPQERYDKIVTFYDKHGFFVLLFGRFIPFGVRNGLFITAGMMKMNFLKFIISDGIACLISNATVFTIAYKLGQNKEILMEWIGKANVVIFTVAIAIVTYLVWRKFFRKETSSN
jgi:membrane protein DedA with SNARE-associated domain